ncbi:MAG: PH domain-containing protein [Thermoanaerobaculia bacterium]
MHRFAVAPWSPSLKVMSVFSLVVLVGVPWFVKRVVPPVRIVDWVVPFVAWTCAAVMVGSILFVVTGYEVGHNHLLVHRLFWPTRVDIRGLTRVWHDPAALKGSLRVFGNGGLFSFSGLFYNRALGWYRLFATDPKRAVVMALPARTVVVTPEDPDAFIRAVRALFPGARS